MRFQLITKMNQIFPHGIQLISTDETRMCRWMTRTDQILTQILLFLTYSQPTKVKIIPELQSFGIK